MTFFKLIFQKLKRCLKSFMVDLEFLQRTGTYPPMNSVFLNLPSIKIGENFNLGEGCTLSCQDPENGSILEIGTNVSLNSGVKIISDKGGKIFIHDHVLIGPNVIIRGANHQFSDRTKSIKSQGHSAGTIVIESDVWIGGQSVILPNVTLGKGSVIGPGSVVTKSVEPFTIVGGVPAKLIGQR